MLFRFPLKCYILLKLQSTYLTCRVVRHRTEYTEYKQRHDNPTSTAHLEVPALGL